MAQKPSNPTKLSFSRLIRGPDMDLVGSVLVAVTWRLNHARMARHGLARLHGWHFDSGIAVGVRISVMLLLFMSLWPIQNKSGQIALYRQCGIITSSSDGDVFECDGDGRMQWCHKHEHRINITRTIPNACLLYNGYVPVEDCSSLPAAHVLETISYQKLIILNAHGCQKKLAHLIRINLIIFNLTSGSPSSRLIIPS